MSQKLAVYGQWTYRGAWALEITAAVIGLATGLALGFQAISADATATAMDLTLASAPFFMIAIAELTKIPIATLLFSASWFWKPAVLVFLLLLAGVTFETVFMGLERAGTLREYRYETIVNDIGKLQTEAIAIEAAESSQVGAEVATRAKAELDAIVAQADNELRRLREMRDEVDAELSQPTALTPEASVARDQVDEIVSQRMSLIHQRDAELSDAMSAFERQRDSFERRIEAARSDGDRDSVRRLEQELSRLANPRAAIMRKYEELLAPIERSMADRREAFDRLRQLGPAMTDSDRQRLATRKANLDEEYSLASIEWREREAAARQRWLEAQETQAESGKVSVERRLRLNQIQAQIAELEQERIPLARTDQVRRIAGRWFGVRPEEVAESEAGTVAVVWFGSLALLAALAGPVTAMVALGLQKIAVRSEEHRENRLAKLVRRLLLHWRWRRIRTVQMPVEVEREREVEKIVEVPVEKLVKEILYVPILTDDPDMVRSAINDTLPPEVADLVKISASQGARRRAGTT